MAGICLGLRSLTFKVWWIFCYFYGCQTIITINHIPFNTWHVFQVLAGATQLPWFVSTRSKFTKARIPKEVLFPLFTIVLWSISPPPTHTFLGGISQMKCVQNYNVISVCSKNNCWNNSVILWNSSNGFPFCILNHVFL